MRPLHLLAVSGVLAVLAGPASARITRLEILRTEPAFGGQAFGAAGPYQHVTARAYGEVDPSDPANAIVQDIALAPRNAKGMVEYTTDVELLKPADMALGNRVLLFEVNNRGNKLALNAFDESVPGGVADRNALSGPGDGWLMRQGYTLVWWGWEMDDRVGMGRVLMPPVIAHNPDGSAITGIVRSEMLTPAPTRSMPISLSQQVQQYPPDSYDSYPAASLDNATATLTVRVHEQDARVPIPNSAWSFATCDDGGAAVPDAKHVCYPAGFQPGHLYELIYRAKDPTVLGLGFVATRDLGAFLRNADASEDGAANPVRRAGQSAIIMGSSQSGRMVRSFLALGFNRGEDGRPVFDGAYPHIGGGLMPLNIRFGQPVRAWGEQTDHLYPAYDFPFSYAKQTDPLTGRSQGVLDRCLASNTCPRIFHVATVLEMWEGRQSLGLTDPLGQHDVPDPAPVRTYIMASTQHAPAPLPLATQPPFGNCQQQPNPNPQLWTMRALLTDFTAWVRDGVEPPASAVPHIADSTLVAPDQVRLPAIPATQYGGVPRPAMSDKRLYDTLHVLDYGPGYHPGDTSGILSIEPPQVGTGSYGILEPQVDADGNDIPGIRSVFEQVPIGTYLGWNLFRAGRLEGGMCNLQGSFIPFAATRAQREAAGDTRPSLEERYKTRDSYVNAIRAATARLVQARFLLPEDAALLNAQAEKDGVRSGP
ncbi:MAG: alpha/beta hydrolase domain-containing protein [Acetobacteraceae bacterium]